MCKNTRQTGFLFECSNNTFAQLESTEVQDVIKLKILLFIH